ncbi:MAG: phosphoglycerate dehydrogenase [Chitinophagaceae bacterium]|nr:phosphoglycerate dehydrogenase [Chitinophagaceae bacterium]
MISYPKNKIRILLLENIHQQAIDLFEEESYQIIRHSGAMTEEVLADAIRDVHLLGIRSKTQVTEKILSHANKLLGIGVFCIGTNQLDLNACSAKGIPVFNAPYSNTRSVVELAIGEMIMLIRNVVTKNSLLHAGQWDKSASNSFEIRGKTLGIVGYGNIGSQLSVLAEAMGMQVVFYDVVDKLALGNARKCQSLQELLKISDVVSLHVDGRSENTRLMGSDEFKLMKPSAVFLNLSRGHVVDIDALQHALSTHQIHGASVDVFPYEPVNNDEGFESPLRGLSNTLLTPHIGGSTEEAQKNIGDFVTRKLIHFVNKGDTYGAVNFPEVQLPAFTNSHRMLHVHGNVPGILAKINTILANYSANIQAQYLKTQEDIGYVITDIGSDYQSEMIQALRDIPQTIRLRILY